MERTRVVGRCGVTNAATRVEPRKFDGLIRKMCGRAAVRLSGRVLRQRQLRLVELAVRNSLNALRRVILR